MLAGLTGAAAGVVLAWVAMGRRASGAVVGAALGALPAALAVAAYFTDAY